MAKDLSFSTFLDEYDVCMRTSATSNVLPSTEFGYPNSLVRGQPLIPR